MKNKPIQKGLFTDQARKKAVCNILLQCAKADARGAKKRVKRTLSIKEILNQFDV